MPCAMFSTSSFEYFSLGIVKYGAWKPRIPPALSWRSGINLLGATPAMKIMAHAEKHSELYSMTVEMPRL